MPQVWILRPATVLAMGCALGLACPALAQDSQEPPSQELTTYNIARPHDETLDLSLPEEELVLDDQADERGTPADSYWQAQGSPRRAKMQRKLGGDWKFDTVLLNRPQAGQPALADDDMSPVTAGAAISHHF